MRHSFSIKAVGLSVSAVLAVLYALVMFASLLLVGSGTTSSWLAALLDIRWSTVAGFEIGLLGVVIVGFAVALAFVPAFNFVWSQVSSKTKTLTLERLNQSDLASERSWASRLLTFLLLLIPLTLILLRGLASAVSFAGTLGARAADLQGPGMLPRAVNMGPIINTSFRDAEPSFTADGRTMYFNCHNADICVSYLTSTWEEGKWTPPERLGGPINTAFREVEPLINDSGDKLYFNSNRPQSMLKDIPFLSPFVNVVEVTSRLAHAKLGISIPNSLGSVWVSYRISDVWSEPRLLEDVSGEPPVNSAFDDHCLAFSPDGNEAFWTSDRPGGFGGSDIWTSRRVEGKWTAPENLGENINGSGNEHHSLPTPDGRSLYVTTVRDSGYGREDIYITTREPGGKWGALVNLGPLVNGSKDDRCPAWTPDLRIFLFDSVNPLGFGAKDIWWVYFKDVKGNQVTAREILQAQNAHLGETIVRRVTDES